MPQRTLLLPDTSVADHGSALRRARLGLEDTGKPSSSLEGMEISVMVPRSLI